MRLKKFSLVAIFALTLLQGLNAADTLSKAFQNGKIGGELKGYYFNRTSDNTSANITSFGTNLNFTTGTYKGFMAGFTAQSVTTPYINTAGKTAFNDDMYGAGAILSQAYLKYEKSDAFLKIGRQYIDSPLVANDDSRIAKDSFEAYSIGYNGPRDTTLLASYITKFQDRTNKEGGLDTFTNIGTGAWTLFATTTLSNFTLSGAYLEVNQDIGNLEAAYAEGVYSSTINKIGLLLNAQYFYGKDKSDPSGANDGRTYAFQISSTLRKFSAYVAYSKNSADKATYAGIGTGSGPIYTAAPIAEANFDAGYSVVALNLQYAPSEALSAYLFYSNDNHSGEDTASVSNYNIYSIGVNYSFRGTLAGFETEAQYEIQDFSYPGVSSNKEVRLKIKYSF